MYNETNSPISPDIGIRSNPFIFWIKVPINIAAFHSDNSGDILYMRVVKSLLIISIIPPERRPFSFIAANTCLSNTIIFAI